MLLKLTKSHPRAMTDMDKRIGANMRRARLACGMSQEKAAESLGISFQQVQKYEKGVNHLSAARLLQVAKLFQRDIVWFYGDATGTAVFGSEPDAIAVLTATKDGYAFAAAFNAITDQAKRNALARWLADNNANAFGGATATYEQCLSGLDNTGTKCR